MLRWTVVRLLVTAIAMLSIQLDPSLVPRKAPRPALPRIDQNACPFEGCQFGRWTVRQPVSLYSTWKRDRTPVGTLQKGQVVTAITGVHITFRPSEILVTAPMAEYGLQPGDRVFGYMNLGEGFFNAWFKGSWVDDFDGSGVRPGCTRDCSATLVSTGRVEWWVQIDADGRMTGWTKQTDRFDGKDALAPSVQSASSAHQRLARQNRLTDAAWTTRSAPSVTRSVNSVSRRSSRPRRS